MKLRRNHGRLKVMMNLPLPTGLRERGTRKFMKINRKIYR
jgi:hypothetical protein